MIMKLKEAVSIYKILGEAKVSTLEESEIIKIVKSRKQLRSCADDYEAFLKDAQEKFKPEDFSDIQEKLATWNSLSEEDKIIVNRAIRAYETKVNLAVAEELEKELDITLEKLNAESSTKLLKLNDWQINKLDELQAIL